MSSPGAAPRAAASLSNARAAASRRNGAKSRGPKTPEGKARCSQNALKHGFRAQKYVVLPDEDAAAFAALEAALMKELAPDGALQTALARRVVAATWRLERAERLEAELFAEEKLPGRSLALALIRDCNGARAFDTLLRYRGGTLAEFWRALRTLKALQAEARAGDAALAPARASRPALAPAPAATPCNRPACAQRPDEPERRGHAGESGRLCDRAAASGDPRDAPRIWPGPLPLPGEPATSVVGKGSASLLAGTALLPARWRQA